MLLPNLDDLNQIYEDLMLSPVPEDAYIMITCNMCSFRFNGFVHDFKPCEHLEGIYI